MSSFTTILEEAARRSNFEPDVRFFQTVWPAIVPEAFARLSRPCGWTDGVLHVEVATAWLEEFQHQRHKLVRRLNDALPWKVSRLEITTGQFEIAGPRDEAPAQQAVELDGPAPDLGDPQLNELALAISKHVARAKMNE